MQCSGFLMRELFADVCGARAPYRFSIVDVSGGALPQRSLFIEVRMMRSPQRFQIDEVRGGISSQRFLFDDARKELHIIGRIPLR